MAVVKTLKWVPVKSETFKAAAYRTRERQLYLRFRDGNIYRYLECPASVDKEFLAAESKGSYFGTYIRNRFRNELVYRNTSRSPRESLEEQLSRSVTLAKARAQKRDAAHTAGVHE